MDPQQLRKAYAGTSYLVLADGSEIAARIAETSDELDAFLAAQGAGRGVFITAANPMSKPRSAEENQAANRRLAERLTGYRVFPHVGQSDESGWREDGFFVLDIATPAAVALAEEFEQFAIVVAEAGKPAELVTTAFAPKGG